MKLAMIIKDTAIPAVLHTPFLILVVPMEWGEGSDLLLDYYSR